MFLCFRKGTCKKRQFGLECETGLRSRTYHVLSGSVLSVWNKVENVLRSYHNTIASRMQIIRMQTENGDKIVGLLIPPTALQALSAELAHEAKVNVMVYNQNPDEHKSAVDALTRPPPLPIPDIKPSIDVKPLGLHASQSSPALLTHSRFKSQTNFTTSLPSPSVSSSLLSSSVAPSMSPAHGYKPLPGDITPLGKRTSSSSSLLLNGGRQTVADTIPSSRSLQASAQIKTEMGIKTEPMVKTEAKEEVKEEVKQEEEEEEEFLSMPTFF